MPTPREELNRLRALAGGLSPVSTGGQQASTEEGRPVFKDTAGDFVTERSITVTDPRINNGMPTNIPTVFNGEILADDAAINAIVQAGGVDPVTKRQLEGFGTIEEAVSSAQQRSQGLGKQMTDQQPLGPRQELERLRALAKQGGQDGAVDAAGVTDAEVVPPAKEAVPGQAMPFQGMAKAGTEPLEAVLTGAIAEIPAGLAGIIQSINPFAEEGAGARAVEATREALTATPKTPEGVEALRKVADSLRPMSEIINEIEQFTGDVGYEAAGPVGGAIGAAVPTAIGEAVGLAAPSVVSKGLKGIGEKAEAEGVKITEEAAVQLTPEEGLKQAAEALQKGATEDIPALVQPDKAFFDAADELGISVEPLASLAARIHNLEH